MSTVTYVEHSGFLLELDDRALLFDYYKGDIPHTDKPLYIFSSHRHHDHFNRKIMEIPCRRLILSSDIRAVPVENMLKIGHDKDIEVDGMNIHTFKSTDEGVAFLVEYKGRMIYHAGDLNDWYWEGEDEAWNMKMTNTYRRIITNGFSGIDELDIAFLPVDGRLGAHSDRGADFFLEKTAVRHVFPMHFWQDYGVVERFCAKHKNAHRITAAPQVFEVDI